jgi:hypothetical protein
LLRIWNIGVPESKRVLSPVTIAAKAQVSGDLQKIAAAKDTEIHELKSKLEASEVSQKLAVTEALSAVEKERDTLANALAQAEREKKAASELAEALLAGELHKVSAAKEKEIQQLKAKLQAVELEKKLAVTEAVGAIEKERDELKNGIKQIQLEKQLSEQSLKDKYETQIKDRDDAIERLKDMKARLSTKMVGETLEQHCETEFNRVRSMAFLRRCSLFVASGIHHRLPAAGLVERIFGIDAEAAEQLQCRDAHLRFEGVDIAGDE